MGTNLREILRDLHLNDAQTARVDDLLAKSRGRLKLPKGKGDTPMYDTVTKNELFTSGLLVEYGARLCDRTPMDVALRQRDLRMLNLLLSYGAKVDEHILNNWSSSNTSKPPSLEYCRSVNELFTRHRIYYQLPESGAL